MPVHFDEYQADDGGPPVRPGSNGHRILSFLLAHPKAGFTPTEIAEATDVARGSVGPTLQRLADRGLVRHKEPYWAAAEDDRLASYEASLTSLESLDSEEWRAVDSREQQADEEELVRWRASQEES